MRGILHHREASSRVDGVHAGGSVVQRAGKEHPDHTGAEVARSAPKQGIDGGTVAVLARPAGEAEEAVFHQQMQVGAPDVDVPRDDLILVGRRGGRERGGAAQNGGQRADALWRKVMHNKNRGRKMAWEIRYQLKEGVDAPGRESDHYDIVPWHIDQSGLCRFDLPAVRASPSDANHVRKIAPAEGDRKARVAGG